MRIIELTNYDLILHGLDIGVIINHTKDEIDKPSQNSWVVYDKDQSYEKLHIFLSSSPITEYSFLITFKLYGRYYRDCKHLIPTRHRFIDHRLSNAQNQIKSEIFNLILLNPKDIISNGQICQIIDDVWFRV